MLNWKPYNNHHWAKSKQKPLNNQEKKKFEQMAANTLLIPFCETGECWGTVHPPGRNAIVIQVRPEWRHQYSHYRLPIGLKIYNLKDGKVMWPSIRRFHQDHRPQMRGLPNAHVQEVLACGTTKGTDGIERGYLVQQWIDGVALDQKIKAGPTTNEVLQITDDLFQEIIIPLWSHGSSWWDVRPSNYVVTPSGRLFMIDSDTVGGYADEIIQTPEVFTQRNNGTRTAMKRYGTLLSRLAGRVAGRGQKSIVQRRACSLCERHLQPIFCAPYPLPSGWQRKAIQSWKNFRADYALLLQPPLGLRQN